MSRIVEGASVVKRSGSRSTARMSSRRVRNQRSISGTQVTGSASRSAAKIG
ncbi:hypothetical protein [Candidatus Palauibacter irciniicola]|uniref:hypothetical protein n=1 Tax=Candidatus Palauibacter irciniicola TaxID=3056733 RepID=UPI003B026D49